MMPQRDGTRDEKTPGRPRIYATPAARQRAYRQRRAQGVSAGPREGMRARELRARLQRLEAMLTAVLERLDAPERRRVALIDRLFPPTGGDGGPRPAA